MANGFIFYWISWMFWIIVTFLMKTNQRRLILAIWILVIIYCSNFYITIENYRISLTFFILLGITTYMHARLPNIMYHVFVSFTISIGFTAILLWEINSPVWLFLPRSILIPIICSLLIFILMKDFYSQLVTGVLGMCTGELLYNLLLSSYNLQGVIGEFAFLDNLLLTILLITILNFLQKGKHKLSVLTSTYKKSLQWQNE